MYQQNQTNLDNNALQTDRFSQVQFYIDQARRGRSDYLGEQLRRLRAGLNRQLNLMIPAAESVTGHEFHSAPAGRGPGHC